ncbi:MAG: signal peptidase I [Deltaproteobacteria bacterium]|nr:signal peptidase I [Deltaproteobacteria bacterium]
MPRVTKSRTGVTGEAEGENARPVPRAAAKPKSTVREYAEALAVAFLLALFIRTFLVQAFKIPSGSMLETLQIGDHILVNKLRYGIRLPILGKRVVKFQDPRRGDVIVFVYPVDPSKDFIKRVIGQPGDTVEVRHKQVYINGEKIPDPWGQFVEGPGEGSRLTPRDNFGPVTVPDDQVFVMGDNRDRSYDSRFWGFVPLDDVRGKAFVIYWSWDGQDRWVRWERLGDIIH